MSVLANRSLRAAKWLLLAPVALLFAATVAARQSRARARALLEGVPA